MLQFQHLFVIPNAARNLWNQQHRFRAALEMTVSQALLSKIRRHLHAHQQHRFAVGKRMVTVRNAAIAPAAIESDNAVIMITC